MESTTGDAFFLVTNNSDDYCDPTGDLASELAGELEAEGGTFTVVTDLEALLSHLSLTPLVTTLSRTDDELASFLALASAPEDPDGEVATVGRVVLNAVLNAVDNLVGDEVETVNDVSSGHDFTELAIPYELEGLTIDTIDTNEETLTWQTYETYQGTTFLIQAEIDVDLSLTGFGYKSDLLSREELDGIYVLDWDWNDHMAYVATSTRARLSFQVHIEQGMDAAMSCELEGAAPLGDRDDPHAESFELDLDDDPTSD